MYTIKAVSQATGVSIETLRAWERRYRIVEPLRDPNGRRSYAPPDVVRLRNLREATERGHAISKLARLSEEQLAAVLATPAQEDPTRFAANSFSAQMLAAAENYRPDLCAQAMSMALALLPILDVVSAVLCPALVTVGERWRSGDFSIAQERIITGTVRRQVGAVLETYSKISTNDPLVFATLPGERHDLGLLMGALIAASKGINCHYLGADIPAADIATYATRVHASGIALAFVMEDQPLALEPALAQLLQQIPPQVHIWVGGRGTAQLDSATLGPRITKMPNYTVFHAELDTLLAAAR
jgi:MerR family transcriptional regulator, light-induced transcriptional regulator